MGEGHDGARDDQRDWVQWHAPYDDAGSPLERRLRVVQRRIAEALVDRGSHEVRILSGCAGQGRDLIEVLARMPSRAGVRARLVELDERNVEVARRAVAEAGLAQVEVLCADAGSTDAYVGAAPVDLLLLCGVFGNITDDDVRRTIEHLPRVCAARATVIWTRSRRAPDLTPAIRDWFARDGFVEQSFDAPCDALYSVGVHRFEGSPLDLLPGTQLFRFVDGCGA